MSDSRELSTAKSGGAVVQSEAQSQVERMFEMVISAATNPDVDPAKMAALVDLQVKMMDYQKQEQFNRDKVAALLDMPSISKRGEIIIPAKEGRPARKQGNYAKWEDLHSAVTPILGRNNLVMSFNIGSQGQQIAVQPILSHRNGYVEKGEFMPVPLDTSGSKNNTQAAGSAASYAKRYAATAMLNLKTVNEDDDGQAAGGTARDPSAFLTDAEAQLAASGEKTAKQGPIAYQEWFSVLSTTEKGWLVMSGRHERFKNIAANL